MEYFDSGKQLTCSRCGKSDFANISCPNGHYICDECHGKDVFDTIRELVINSKSSNPFEIAEILMGYHDRVPMLGCENAWIAAGALMAALKNRGTIRISNEQIDEALNRTRKQAIGGYCGLTGVCGIAPAIGACFSVILGAACPKDQETAATMRVVGKIVNAIADQTGPCCCKNFVRTALTEAVPLAKEHLNVNLQLPAEKIICTHVDRHPHGCREEKCSYYSDTDSGSLSHETFDYLIRKATVLGVDEAKIIDTSTVAVGEWVQWKCQYGCPFYDKDALHPPLAPGTEETKKVLSEYKKALLLNGSNGPLLSQHAMKIEQEAYSLGLYKAFALLALPFGASPS